MASFCLVEVMLLERKYKNIVVCLTSIITYTQAEIFPVKSYKIEKFMQNHTSVSEFQSSYSLSKYSKFSKSNKNSIFVYYRQQEQNYQLIDTQLDRSCFKESNDM